jgi:putative tryptophan/tyrosine transport system substrate-binding protein
MRLIGLAVVLALGLVLAPLAVEAQPTSKIPRIGILQSYPPNHPLEEAFRQGLRDVGYVEGRNIVIEYRWSETGQFGELAAELVRLNVDVIVAPATPAVRAARQATTTIPIVFATVGDPVGTGMVASLARPGGNITGVSLISSDLAGKRLELLREAVPRLERIAVLFNPDVPGKITEWNQAQVAASTLRIELQSVQVRAATEFERAFEAIVAGRAGALMVLGEPLMFNHRARIATFAVQHRLPLVGFWREFAESGALLSHGPSLTDNMRRAAVYVDKILKGTKPSDLPVEQPTKFELVINLKTAKALGLTIPQSLLGRADQIIE